MFLILCCSLLLLFIIYEFYWKRRGLPPGPMPYPFIGNMMEMFSYPAPGFEAFANWTKTYGDIYTIWMGNIPTVFITSYKSIKETFVDDGDSYIDKMLFGGFNESIRGGDYGVIDVNGDVWREHRRFAMHSLRDFGVGKEAMQDSILLEIDKMIEEINENPKDVKIQNLMDIAVGNIINQFLFGHRFEKSEKFEELKSYINTFFEAQGSIRVYTAYSISWLPQSIVDFVTPDIIEFRNGVFNFFTQQIEEHKTEIDYDCDENKDYVEAYLKEQKKRQAIGDFESFSDVQLKNMCFDMWIAGMHTTTNTLGFLIAFAIRFPEKQDKMQEELSNIIGDRVIGMKDKLDLPYTNAFINESQRFSNIVPINLPHATTRDVQLNGYTLPKGTAVVHQISSIMNDEQVFPDPHLFQPERFLDETGKLKKIQQLLPFSIGKRVCLGEGLARMELFLFTANLFNRYKFSSGSSGVPSSEKTFAFISKNELYTCSISPRY